MFSQETGAVHRNDAHSGKILNVVHVIEDLCSGKLLDRYCRNPCWPHGGGRCYCYAFTGINVNN